MQNKQNKVVLVTGGARRIGAEICSHLHSKGMNVVIHYNTSFDSAKALREKLNKERPGSASLVKADLENIADIERLMQETLAQWNRLDVVVNNASKFFKTDIEKTNSLAFDELMYANVRAPLFISQLAAPYLANTRGCIINIADIHGEKPLRDYSIYSISKAGLIMLTKVLAKELGPNIRVNAISPGEIAWPEGDNTLPLDLQEKIISRTALLRHGEPMAIAKAVAYLANDADYVTGHILVVDGGRLLTT